MPFPLPSAAPVKEIQVAVVEAFQEHPAGAETVMVPLPPVGPKAPDLAIATYGENIEAAKRAAGEAIRSNLEAYREAGQRVPEAQCVSKHLGNPEFRDLLFAYVDVAEPQGRIAA